MNYRFKIPNFGYLQYKIKPRTLLKQKRKTMIEETLKLIKQYTGLELTLCDYFTGVQKSPNGSYFNVVLDEPLFSSYVHTQLERFANQYGLIEIAPNGYKRLAIFPKQSNNA